MTDSDRTQLTLDGEDPPPESGCQGCAEKYSDPEEFFNLLAMVSLAAGVVLIAVGYIYPREFSYDPDTDARTMEQLELHYSHVAYALDVCIVTGMVLVALGGVCMAGIMMYMACTGQFSSSLCPDQDERAGSERQALQMRPGSPVVDQQEQQPTYGTAPRAGDPGLSTAIS